MKRINSRTLFVIAGVLFFAAAWAGGSPAFYGIGACFLALGITWKREDK